MSQEEKSAFVDDQVVPQIVSVIREAKKEVIIITPYVDLEEWRHAKRAIEEAVSRRVEIKVVVRDDQAQTRENAVATILWFVNNEVKVYMLPDLHAKIYVNEMTTLISSMNFTRKSGANSREIALLVRSPEDVRVVRNYVDELVSAAEPLPLQRRAPPLIAEQPARYSARTPESGWCVRCRAQLPFDRDHPLCDRCYDAWAQYHNPDYRENFCHMCGRPSSTS